MAEGTEVQQPPATGEPNNPPAPPAAPPAPEGTEGGGDLGDAGKKALAEERRARREAEARLKELEPIAAKAKQLEDAKKSEAEKLTEKLSAAETRAQAAEDRAMRLEVAAKKGLTQAQAKRLVGTTPAELEADADELLASFGGTGDTGGAKKPAGNKKPVEQLRPGGLPNPPDPTTAEQIAAAEKAKDWDKAQQLKARQLMALTNPST